MKVLYIASEPAPGMVAFASALINEKGGDAEPYAITLSDERGDYPKQIAGNVQHIALLYPSSLIGKITHKLFPLGLLRLIEKTAKQEGISEICLLTGEYGLTFAFSSRLRRKFNVRFIVHDLVPHEVETAGIKERFFLQFFGKMTRKAIKVYPVLETCSRTQADKLLEMYPGKEIRFRPFPSLVTEEMRSGESCPPEVEEVEKFILFFGRVELYKGTDLLYNAFLDTHLKDSFKLVIAGPGALGFEPRKNESNIIRINRFIADKEVSWLFAHASLVVYPYRSVTMSGVLSIAHWFRTPALISDLPFFVDNAEAGDTLFKAGDIESLKQMLEKTLTVKL